MHDHVTVGSRRSITRCSLPTDRSRVAGSSTSHSTLTPMGNAIGRHLPPSVSHVYTAGLLIPLLVGGIVIALLGALLPAIWAAKTRTATALRTE